ncbi:MAG: hypothetical protein NT001_04495 [Candidatus Woesearchaeota archaeon]|nr:hypothetical protein [Candidatus Woesearchaeota archaeon]
MFTDLGFNPKEVRHIGTRYNERGIDVDASYLMIDSEGRNVFTVMDGSPSDNIRGEEIKIYGTKGDISIRFEGKGSNSYIQMHGKEAVKIDISRAIQDIRALGIEDPFSHPALIHNFLSRICGYSAMNGNPGMGNTSCSYNRTHPKIKRPREDKFLE